MARSNPDSQPGPPFAAILKQVKLVTLSTYERKRKLKKKSWKKLQKHSRPGEIKSLLNPTLPRGKSGSRRRRATLRRGQWRCRERRLGGGEVPGWLRWDLLVTALVQFWYVGWFGKLGALVGWRECGCFVSSGRVVQQMKVAPNLLRFLFSRSRDKYIKYTGTNNFPTEQRNRGVFCLCRFSLLFESIGKGEWSCF